MYRRSTRLRQASKVKKINHTARRTPAAAAAEGARTDSSRPARPRVRRLNKHAHPRGRPPPTPRRRPRPQRRLVPHVVPKQRVVRARHPPPRPRRNAPPRRRVPQPRRAEPPQLRLARLVHPYRRVGTSTTTATAAALARRGAGNGPRSAASGRAAGAPTRRRRRRRRRVARQQYDRPVAVGGTKGAIVEGAPGGRAQRRRAVGTRGRAVAAAGRGGR